MKGNEGLLSPFLHQRWNTEAKVQDQNIHLQLGENVITTYACLKKNNNRKQTCMIEK